MASHGKGDRPMPRKSGSAFGIVAATALAMMLTGAPAMASTCPPAKDTAALQVRTLQSHLMVAGLSCGQSAQYNQFVSQFESELVTQGKSLTSYFNRQYGGAARKELNAYVTRMANEASRRSMTNRKAFCQESQGVFQTLSAMPKGNLVSFISDQSPFSIQDDACATRTAQKQ
ncbi:hypothetical protein CKO38_02575 [Rhodospirillum rubrum]|uniref:hypothetical protein n=1 Tax=Rhodospirillum rubrum TaxID=1085 RepID=UPI00190675BA|nr:hypothetical protein [Rhodospirillum rubrum]MBK1663403.1 hypothetical protein [Rhodospirillum rubrum]MBK1675575.1 hypothetical protein [Rhodospirillum rubrum]